MEGFAKLRNGIREHIKSGAFSANDLGVYTYLHLECDYSTGIYFGSAASISSGFGSSVTEDQIRHSLKRLKERGYINYRKGTGKRGNYPILIDKFEPTFGEYADCRLDAWKQTTSVTPVYSPITCGVPVASLSSQGGVKDESPMRPRRVHVASPNPYLPYLPDLTDFPEVKTSDLKESEIESEEEREFSELVESWEKVKNGNG